MDSGSYFTDGMYLWQLYIKQVYRGGSGGGKAGSGNPGCRTRGSDPGKIGLNNLLEKDINLAITKKVKKCLEKEKITAELTRKEDKGLGTTGDGSKKTEDMQARVKMINETKPVLTVSIHQNSYEDPEIHGAQVFYYSHSREGEAVAKILQESLQEIDPENHRQAKANETYYLLRRTKVPTVIVECGFLTNPEEAEKLSGEEYQSRLQKLLQKESQNVWNT